MKRPIILSVLLFLTCLSLAAQLADPKPNIVLILADDLGWSDLGCYGGEIPTPHLDGLAAGGLRFTQFYNNSVCGPTRASLLTGLYAQRIGHSGAHWNQPSDFTRSLTLGEALQGAGYHTMVVGKWQDPDLPAKRGFHRFFGPMCRGKISYFDEVLPNPFYLDETRATLPEDFYLTDAITDHALTFLAEHAASPEAKEMPFFLYVAHVAPHWPLHAREADIAPHRARYRERGWDDWLAMRRKFQEVNGLVPAAWSPAPRPREVHAWADDSLQEWQAERMAVYAAQVASIDRSTGRILEALRARGELDNTLVLFLSDNGPAPDGGLKPGSSGLGFKAGTSPDPWRLDGSAIRAGSGPNLMPGPPDTFAAYGLAWALTSGAPFRGTKLTGYEGGIRTPLIAHWPKGITARGRIVNDVGHVIDLMPTLLELAGGNYPTSLGERRPLPLDGRSFAPLLRGESLPPRGSLAWRVPQHRMIRSGDWKLISRDENTPWELYDLAADGTETTNLAERCPDVVKQLTEDWQAWAESCQNSKSFPLEPNQSKP